MINNIQFNGLSSVPDDYQAPDGDLAVSVNTICENHSLHPVMPPNLKTRLPEGYEPLLLHHTAAQTNLIVFHRIGPKIQLCYADYDNIPLEPAASIFVSINSSSALPNIYRIDAIHAVGNTLAVMADCGLLYILYTGQDQDGHGSYKNLGTTPPLLPLAFSTTQVQPGNYSSRTDPSQTTDGLVAWRVMNTPANSSTCHIGDDKLVFDSSVQSDVTQAVWALVNSTNATITEQNHFYAPFFVRYAYRLYDGTLIKHSAPVFIPVATPSTFRVEFLSAARQLTGHIEAVYPDGSALAPDHTVPETDGSGLSFHTKLSEGKGLDYFTLRYHPTNVALAYRCTDTSQLNSLADWSDIISSIDIFVSLPVLREDDSATIKSASPNNGARQCAKFNYPVTFPQTTYNGETFVFDLLCDIPSLSDDDYMTKIHDVSSFYLIKSIPLTSVSGEEDATVLSLAPHTLSSLATQELMTDDYHSHNLLMPHTHKATLFSYNSRLHVAGAHERLFQGFSIASLVPDVSAYTKDPGIDGTQKPGDTVTVTQIVVLLKTAAGQRAVEYTEKNNGVSVSAAAVSSTPLFYPDNRAFAMELTYRDGSNNVVTHRFPLQPATMLNGAFSSGNLSFFTDLGSNVTDTHTYKINEDMVPALNKIFTSAPNNPFFFPLLGINTVGSGSVLALASATKALSQGQFGQFPLYAFCSDGIWALQVSASGAYSAISPVSRDVCSSPESITQLDDSVAFVSQQGVMLLAGSKVSCLSSALSLPLSDISLPRMQQLYTLCNFSPSQVPFLSYINHDKCIIIFDYPNRRLIVSNPAYNYSYLYSLQYDSWATLSYSFSACINAYPTSLAVSGQELRSLDYQEPDLDKTQQTLIITRPLKLGGPDTLKTALSLLLQGSFQPENVRTVLYGSRDLIHWHLIASGYKHRLRNLHGSPYKYFVIAITSSLSPHQSLNGASAELVARHTNHLH